MSAKNDIAIIVPFGTFRPGNSWEDITDDDDCLSSDEDFAAADTTITAQYPVEDVAEASRLMSAAETLGFHCLYISGDKDKPNDDDQVGMVTITLKGLVMYAPPDGTRL